MPSFDVVSKVEMQEVVNAVDQTKREIGTRYDFKDTKCTIELKEKEKLIILLVDDQMRLAAVQEILKQKLAKRQISLKAIEFKDATPAGGDMLRQEIVVKQGLSTEEAKRIVKVVKDAKMKVTSAIQGEEVRISGKKRDDLQDAISLIKGQVTDLSLQFVNFRE